MLRIGSRTITESKADTDQLGKGGSTQYRVELQEGRRFQVLRLTFESNGLQTGRSDMAQDDEHTRPEDVRCFDEFAPKAEISGQSERAQPRAELEVAYGCEKVFRRDEGLDD